MNTKTGHLTKLFLGGICATLLCVSSPLVAADSQKDSDWEFGGSVYLWGANITARTTAGGDTQIPFYKLLDNLQMAVMGAFEARKDKWSVVTDVIYMDVKAKVNRDPGFLDLDVRGSVELKSWIVSPTARYLIHDTEKTQISLLGGLRYLWLDTAVKVNVEDQNVFDQPVSGANWNAIVGAKMDINLTDKWYIPAYLDIGTGDSKSTWQAMAGIGYRFRRVNMVLTYRYLDFDFKNDSPILSEMTMKGPLAGITFNF